MSEVEKSYRERITEDGFGVPGTDLPIEKLRAGELIEILSDAVGRGKVGASVTRCLDELERRAFIYAAAETMANGLHDVVAKSPRPFGR